MSGRCHGLSPDGIFLRRRRHRALLMHVLAAALLASALAVQPAVALPYRGDATAGWAEQAIIFAADGGMSDFLGWSVALSGDTALVGVWGASPDDQGARGAAYVFTREDGMWLEQAKLLASDGAALHAFGWSVALEGDIAVIGAPCHPTAGCDSSGAAYVFVRDGGNWSEQARLVGSDSVAGDFLGVGVAVSGTTVVAGAPNAQIDGVDAQGAAYTFEFADGIWQQQAKMVASDGAFLDQLGTYVAMDGDTVLAGAPGAAGGGGDQGAAYAFVRVDGAWNEQAKLLASDGAAGDRFSAVALSGETAIVGAPFATVNGNWAQGAAYVFTREGTSWSEQARLVAPDGGFRALFGAVALEGDLAVIGAPSHAVEPATANGAVYVFAREGVTWTAQPSLQVNPPSAQLGASVAVSGDTVLAGAPAATVGETVGQGVAYVFVRQGAGGGPVIEVQPESVSETAGAGEHVKVTVTVSNPGGAPLEWATMDAPGCSLWWVGVAPQSGAVPAGGSQDIVLTLPGMVLDPGEYVSNLCITSNDPDRPVVSVLLMLTVTGGGEDGIFLDRFQLQLPGG